jgi:hypothetical protein
LSATHPLHKAALHIKEMNTTDTFDLADFRHGKVIGMGALFRLECFVKDPFAGGEFKYTGPFLDRITISVK